MKEINDSTNRLILDIPDISNKFVNKFIKYSLPPKGYERPVYFCKDSDKCKLSKKEICQSITENFIVRNNIIAAILTAIPREVEHKLQDENGDDIINHTYEGGICYQKFMNLENCKICVPYDFKDLKNRDIDKILKKILEKADYLDDASCKENNGYLLSLSKKEIENLSKKVVKSSAENIALNPKIKYNLMFIQFKDKLKQNYFDNLNLLIEILEKIQSIPIINNATLNVISMDCKNILDNMYNMCHYYYIYAIISLINSDISDNIEPDNTLETHVAKALL